MSPIPGWNPMKMDQLRLFLAVVDHGGFTRAAEASHITQPALSKQVAKLERELGAMLFVREPSGARPSEAGRRLIPHARAVFGAAEEAARAVREQEPVGVVRIASIPHVPGALWSGAAEALCQRHPGSRLLVRLAQPADIPSLLRAGEADLAVTYLPASGNTDDLACGELFADALVLLPPPGRQVAGPTPVRDLATLPLVLPPPGNCVRQALDEAASAAGVKLAPVAEFEDEESLRFAVNAGFGYGVSRPPAAGVPRVRLIEPTPRRVIGWLRRGRPSRAAAAAETAVAAAIPSP